ncbi:YfhO family protein [Adlercreutzia sp. R25]|uniref:YfhO family protein n=1 Tax=Adlercreutzia shanghongiae TaxID=3111773 RepID=UPI002DBD8FBA|nr:YfhO family protein [Adlercreutzia sp. R25]MEC4273294.1 YfhO family protein [Adlercreutzia sp. R25]
MQGKRVSEADDFAFARPLKLVQGKLQYSLVLFGVCLIAFFAVILVLVVNSRSLVWNTDGRLLYYPFLLMEGEWLRDGVAALLSGRGGVPAYSFSYGLGADQLVAGSGNFNEPLNLLSVFAFPENAEAVYAVLIFVRFYLAALTFSLYLFSRGMGKSQALCGSIAYVTCGFVLFWGVLRHPNFIDFAILLPLVFMGADRLFAKKNPLLLVVSMTGPFVYSVYFGYMACITLFFYCVIGYFVYPRERCFKDFFVLVGKFIVSLAASFFLVAFSSIPMFMALSSMGRVGVSREVPFFQSFDFYQGYSSMLLGNHASQTSFALGAVSVLAIVVLFAGGSGVNRYERRAWRWGVVLCVVGSLLSAVGSLMNGFGYATDRWGLAFGFCAAYAVALLLPQLLAMEKRQWAYVAFGVVVLAAWAYVYAFMRPSFAAIAAPTMLVVIFACTAFWAFLRRRFAATGAKSRILSAVFGRKALCIFLVLAMLANVAIHAGLYLSSRGASYAEEFNKAGDVLGTRMQLDLSSAIEELDVSYRVDRPDTSYGRNASYMHGYKGIDFYSSFYNQAVDDFRQSLGLADDVKSTMFDGTQERLALDGILAGRYYVASREAAAEVPYSYDYVGEIGEAHNGKMYDLYESSLPLPIAFVYDETVSRQTYDSLNMVQRQELLTRAMVIEEDFARGERLALSSEVGELELKSANGASLQPNRVVVEEANASLAFAFGGVSDAESYVCFEGLSYISASPRALRTLAENSEMSVSDASGGMSFAPRTSSVVGVRGSWSNGGYGGRETTFDIVTSANPRFSGKSDWAVNLGYSQNALDECTITFSAPGVYMFEDLYAAMQPVGDIEANLKELQSFNTASIAFGDDSMSISVGAAVGRGKNSEVDDMRYVFVSVPYSSGWTATLDGSPVAISKANVGFMGVEIDGQAHQLEFHYETPGKALGLMCSAICGVLLVLFEVLWFSRREKKRELSCGEN